METMQMRIDRLRAEKAEIEQIEAERSLTQDEIDRKNFLSNQLAEAEHEYRLLMDKEERELKAEEKIERDIRFNVSGVDFTNLPADVIQLINIVVKNDRKRIYAEHNEEVSGIQRGHHDKQREAEEERLQLQRQNNELQKRVRETYEEFEAATQEANTLRAANQQLTLERDDAYQTRDNAANELDEARKEIERLKDKMERDARAHALGERQAQNVIDITPETGENVQDLVNSIAKRYERVEDWGSVQKVVWPDGSFELMKRDEVEKLQPIEAPEIPVLQFRDEANTQNDQLHFAEAPEIVTDEQFRSGNSNNPEAPMVGDNTRTETGVQDKEAVSDTVTREEFEALKKRVESIENSSAKAAA